jgi:uncharacterized protein (DUF849 family)
MPKTKWFDRKFEFELSQNEFSKVLNRLKDAPERIEQLIYSVSPEIPTKKIDDSWSIQEHIGHIIDLEELHEERINDFINKAEQLRAADMTNKKTHEADHNLKEITKLLQELRTTREKLISRFGELDESVLSHIALHPRLKQPMRPIDMAQFVAEHDDHHINSIIEITNIHMSNK